MLSPEELLAGGGLTYEVPVPGNVLRPGNGAAAGGARSTVRLRPLTVSDLQLVTRAARENDSLVGVLMADIEPVQGIHLMLTGEALNRGAPKAEAAPLVPPPMGSELLPESIDENPGDGETRLGGWVTLNWFPFPHFDVRVDAVARQNRPLLLMAQGHFYF